MIVNNRDIIRNLYRININSGNNSVIVIRSKVATPKQKFILLGKIYCQGFSLISARNEKERTLFVIKKVQEPKLLDEKFYSFFQTLIEYPYCEYLTPDILSDIGFKLSINPKEKYTFLGKLLNLHK